MLNANQEKSIVRPLIVGGLLALTLAPWPALAAEVCCACQAADNSSATSCYTLDSSKLDSPNDCSTLPSAAKLEKATCTAAPLGAPNQGKCRPVADGGVCANSPVNAYAAAPAPGEPVGAKTGAPGGAAPVQKDITPQLNVQIPGFAFTGSEATSEQSTLFASYVAGLYRYALSIAALAATVMFVFGAFRYLIGAGMENVRRGKEIMLDAVVGMLLVIGAHLILRTINPATLNLTTLNLTSIKTIEIEPRTASGPAPFSKAKSGADPQFVDALKRASHELSFDACVALAICEHETALRIDRWNGDYAGTKKENASYFGCGVGWYHLKPNGIAWKKIHEKFPELPQEPDKDSALKPKIADLMTTNYDLMAYAAVAVMKQVRAATVRGLDSYASGGGGTALWAKKTGCSTNITVKEAGKDPASGLEKGCIPPGYVAVTCGGSECDPCAGDNYLCSSVKVNSKSEFKGTCKSTDKPCTAMDSTGFVKYVVNAYSRMQSTYQCD